MSVLEEPTYLHVDPYCGDKQLIHMESIAGSNVAILATFTCVPHEDGGKVKVEKATFEVYPMFGLITWGFKTIEPQKNPNNDDLRVIKIVMGVKNVSYSLTIPFEDIVWEEDDIIDNEMYFDILGLEIRREDLKETLEDFKIYNPSKDESIEIPVQGRPCQFKLVKPLK